MIPTQTGSGELRRRDGARGPLPSVSPEPMNGRSWRSGPDLAPGQLLVRGERPTFTLLRGGRPSSRLRGCVTGAELAAFLIAVALLALSAWIAVGGGGS